MVVGSIDRLVIQPTATTTDGIDAFFSSRPDLKIRSRQPLGDGFVVVEFSPTLAGPEASLIIDELITSGLATTVEPDVMRVPTVVPNDPLFGDQWHLQQTATGISLPDAWNVTRGSSNLVVSVIDTGRLDHPELAGGVVPGYDFVSNPLNSRDGDGWDTDETDTGDWSEPNQCSNGSPFVRSSWHSTHVAGLIRSNDDTTGITGVAPNVRVQFIRVLGACGGRTSDEATAIRWAAGLPVEGVQTNRTPAKVINLSLGSQGPCHSVEQAAINEAVAAGVTVVVAAGNAGLNLDVYDFAPANCNNVITVAATDDSGERAYYSNFGSKVDVAAPGGPAGILSLGNGGTRSATEEWTYSYKSGTSMATPLVTGVAALVLSANPSLTPAEVESIIKDSASPLEGQTGIGTGLLDAASAVQLAIQRSTSAGAQVARFGDFGDRFSTNLAVEALADRTDVILVSGSVYPDGLAASALAKQENADIILVPPTGLGTEQIAAIVGENPQTVWILGGPQAIPTSVETQLTTATSLGGAGIDPTRIERVFGATRYDTAVEVSKRIQTIAYLAAKPTAIVVRGDSFADAVIAGPAAFGITGGIGSHPVFLVNRDTIPTGVVDQLRARGITNVLVVGGTAVVSEAVRLGIESLGISTTRVAGPDRYATAAALGQLLITPIQLGGFGWNAGDIALVDISDTSLGFDAISAVGTLGPTRRILLGVTPLRLPASTATYLATLTDLTTRFTVIGSATAVPDSVVTEATRALAS